MNKLTLEQLVNMGPETIFAQGEIVDSPDGLNMTNSGKLLRWLAKRGRIHDWAVYCHWADQDWYFIETQGDKVHGVKAIETLRERQARIRAESEKECVEIEEKIQQLLLIEYVPHDSN